MCVFICVRVCTHHRAGVSFGKHELSLIDKLARGAGFAILTLSEYIVWHFTVRACVRSRALCAQACLRVHVCKHVCSHVSLTVFVHVPVYVALHALGAGCVRAVSYGYLPTSLYRHIQPGQIDGDNLCKFDTVFSQSKAI